MFYERSSQWHARLTADDVADAADETRLRISTRAGNDARRADPRPKTVIKIVIIIIIIITTSLKTMFQHNDNDNTA